MQELFPQSVLKERFADLYAAAAMYCERYEAQRGRKMAVDPALLLHAVWAAYDDIARYKSYHLDDPSRKRSNAVKRSAYLTKWLLKYRPIIAMDGPSRPAEKSFNDDGVLVNAFFALKVALDHLATESPRLNLVPEKFYELIYDFTYRALGDDGLIVLYQTLIDAKRSGLFRS